MADRNIDKRKMLLFVAIVVIALVCMGLLIVALQNANPRTDPEVKDGGANSRLQIPTASRSS